LSINKWEGNLYLIKIILFLNSMSGYNKSVDDRKLSEIGKDAEKKKGGQCRRPPFLFKSLLFIHLIFL
jgi:hypothetical protein